MVATKLFPFLLLLTTASALEMRLNQHARPISIEESLRLEQVNPDCSLYMCKPASMNLAPDVCIHQENDIYYLQSCANRTDGKTFCYDTLIQEGVDNFCQTPPPEPSGLSWPGEKCTGNSSCITNDCNNKTGLCMGAGKGETCSSNADCGAGLFCTGGECTVLQGKGKTCTTDFDCANYLGCNRTSAFFGVCTPYFSVPIGGHVSDCDADATSYLCESGTCLLQGFTGSGVCIKPITSSKTQPQSCQSDADCVGTSGNLAFQSTCNCGYNPTGTAYCQPFIGDPAGHDSIFYMARLVNMNATLQCNTARRFDYGCINSLPITWGKTAISFNIQFQYYPELQGNDNCIKAIYTNYYWIYTQGYALLLSVLVLGLF